MRRSLLTFLLAASCVLSAACGSKPGGDKGAAQKGANAGGGEAAATKPLKDDVAFAREAVEGLLSGDASAGAAIDWENLKMLGADAGAAYRKTPEENRAEVREGFIEEFSESFKQTEASTGDLKNWREVGREGDRTVVAVDMPAGNTMRVFVVRREGRQLVSELAID